VPGGGDSPRRLTIALSIQAHDPPERFNRAGEADFAVEYTPDPLAPELIERQVKPLLAGGLPVRFHCRFAAFEMGNADPEKAAEALAVHKRAFQAITGLGEPVVTVHLSLSRRIPFDSDIAVANLTRLTEYGRKRGLTVCLENLRRGPSSDPNNVLDWTETSGARITLDVGHAVSSEYVREGRATVPGIIGKFHDKLHEVHIYAKEEDRHYPIVDMTGFTPIVDRLLTTGCDWWTIELEDFGEALDTRRRLLEYLSALYAVPGNERNED
jgi:sugar phosphate isomerase/epimerase